MCDNILVHTKLPPSPVILWAELRGKQKKASMEFWIPFWNAHMPHYKTITFQFFRARCFWLPGDAADVEYCQECWATRHFNNPPAEAGDLQDVWPDTLSLQGKGGWLLSWIWGWLARHWKQVKKRLWKLSKNLSPTLLVCPKTHKMFTRIFFENFK